MALNTAQGFHVGSAQPIDDKFKLTKAEMLTIDENIMPEQYFCVCVDDGNMYTFDKNREANAETGKFRIVSGNGVDLQQNYPLKIPVYSRRDPSDDDDKAYLLIATIDLTNLEAITHHLEFRGTICDKQSSNVYLYVDVRIKLMRGWRRDDILHGTRHGDDARDYGLRVYLSLDKQTAYVYVYGSSVAGEITIAKETTACTIPTTFTWQSSAELPKKSDSVDTSSFAITNTKGLEIIRPVNEITEYSFSTDIPSAQAVYNLFLQLQSQLTSLTNTIQEVEE